MQEATAAGIEDDAWLPDGGEQRENLRVAERDKLEAAIAVEVDGVDAPDVLRERKGVAFEAWRAGRGRRLGAAERASEREQKRELESGS